MRKPRQRSCDEKDAKGKLCAGHLKRWYDYPKEVQAKIGEANAENLPLRILQKTLYKPDPKQMPAQLYFALLDNFSEVSMWDVVF